MILRKGLLSLPTELRNQIYRLVVVVDEDNVGGVARDTAICISPIPYRSHVCDLTDWRYQPALTRVSRQVRAESLPVYYGENEFVAFAWFRTGKRFPVGGPDLEAWLRGMGSANMKLLHHCVVRGLWPRVTGVSVAMNLRFPRSRSGTNAVRMDEFAWDDEHSCWAASLHHNRLVEQFETWVGLPGSRLTRV